MTPRFETIPAKKLIGKRLTMTFANDRTFELWRSLRVEQKSITNPVSTDFLNVQVYGASFDFGADTPFEKWAAVEVADFDTIPDGMEAFLLPGGLYAVFHYKGPASGGAKTFQAIFGTWLPASDYALDNRPHFEVLGASYKPDDPAAEEALWIPIKFKK